MINISIQEIGIKALADSWSQISCVSEEFYEEKLDTFRKCPTLLIIGISVVGATGGRPIRLRKQVFVKLKFGNMEYQYVLLVVPQLPKKCVLRVDILKPLGAIIDFQEDTLTLHEANETFTLRTQEESIENNLIKNIGELFLTNNRTRRVQKKFDLISIRHWTYF